LVLAIEPPEIRVLKTELTLEPIRADALSLLRAANRILHLEFQTLPVSKPPMPLRMLDYSVRLKRKYRCSVEQVVIFLQETTNEVAFTEEYRDDTTIHRYRVIRLWEQDSSLFLTNLALLPLAALTKSDSPQALLEDVAEQVASIEEIEQRQNIASCAGILAGLRFEEDLIRQLFREDIMRESVIYQSIRQEGKQEGLLNKKH
jgi:predicted transposase YdaD